MFLLGPPVFLKTVLFLKKAVWKKHREVTVPFADYVLVSEEEENNQCNTNRSRCVYVIGRVIILCKFRAIFLFFLSQKIGASFQIGLLSDKHLKQNGAPFQVGLLSRSGKPAPGLPELDPAHRKS